MFEQVFVKLKLWGKILNNDKFVKSNKINHNPNWPYISDHPYKFLIIAGSGSNKTNALLNLIKYQGPDIDKIYLYIKNLLKLKYHLLINGREKVKKLKNPKAFMIVQKQLTMPMKSQKTIIQQEKGKC